MAFRLLNSLRLLAAGAPFPSLYDSVAVRTIRGPALIVSRRLADSYAAAGGGGGSGSASGSQQHQGKNANQDIPVQSSEQGGQGQRASQEQNQDSNRSASSSSSSNSAGSSISGSRGSQHWPDTELLKADRAGRRRHPAYFRGFEDDWDWNLPSPSSFFSELSNSNSFPWGSEASPARQRQGRMTYFQPKVDIADEGQTLVFHAEVPGMSQKDLKVEITEDRLRLSGEKSEEKMEKEKNWTRQERTKGFFTREFPLPRGVDPSQISAKLKDGVLEIRVPKPVQITTHAVNIE